MCKPNRHLGAVLLVLALLGLVAGFRFYLGARLPADWAAELQRAAPWVPEVQVEKVVLDHDQDGDGIPDLDDTVQGAREYVRTRPRYRDGYYAGGYPPPGEGVCTDVIWQSLRAAGYDLKAMVDADIRAHPDLYPRVGGKPDPNIDFRRVANLVVFFERHAASLTTEVRPGDPENLKQWQAGDIVVFGPPLAHIAVVSDRRRPDGVPYLLHNAGPCAAETDALLSWPTPITHHFRFPDPKKLPAQQDHP
ncbi:MAG: DUF1287 domain-containing protein [Clostridia bacterium]|jgi:uncharacterized protein YijF (DUF1287 family)|nr:DUF1287 domain-containing protein [Clostridia bacterium]MDH7573030.1 DUF1287 domain-containing protein [Clostridia bacterium]